MQHRHDNPDTHDTLVIGGGISGLTAAWRLKRNGQRVLLVEANERVGGAIGTTRQDGYLLEHGPFNVLVRSGAFGQLLEDLRETLEVVHADAGASGNRYVLFEGRLHRTPSGPGDVLFNSLLSPRERFRLMRGLLWSRPGDDECESLDSAARRRLGNGAADKLVSALAVGVYGGESKDIEFSSCVPKISRIERGVRSPILAMMRAKRSDRSGRYADKGPVRIRGMVSFAGGLQDLPRALAGELGDSVWTNAAATSISQAGDGVWKICASVEGEIRFLSARNVVLATGHQTSTRLLRDVSTELAKIVGEVAGSSMVVVNLGFRKEQVGHSLDGYGLLAAGTERSCPYLGVLFASSIFPHHAPDGCCVMRVFRGGSRHPDAADKSDDENVAEVMEDLRRTLGITGEPDLVHICRWPDAIPLYIPGHGAKMRRAMELAQGLEGLYLAGNYTDGVSIGSCVERAERIASEILNASSGEGVSANCQESDMVTANL